jgi:hypothetical protein
VIKVNKNKLQDHQERLLDNIYAYFLAQNYRRQIFLNEVNIVPLFYSPVIIFEIKDGKNFLGQTVLCGEYMISNPSSGSVVDPIKEFIKYTNNSVFNLDDTIASFSHFTHVITKGLLLVNDLQGFQNILIDPAIQSFNTTKFKSKTNLGEKSMLDYFSK